MRRRVRTVAKPAHEVIGLCVQALQGQGDKEDALRDALAWQAQREEAATEPNARTGKYRTVAQFVDECCVLAPGQITTARELFAAYYAWFESQGLYCPTTHNLSYYLRRYGVTRDLKKKSRYGVPFIGVALIHPGEGIQDGKDVEELEDPLSFATE
jgi:hypothetical protein